MAVKSFFSNLLSKVGNKRKQYAYLKMLNGSLPIFTSFGRDIYASDVVQAAVNRVAVEMSKLQPRHIRTDNEGITNQPKSDFNRLFRYRPNSLMTTSEFLEKVIWLLFMNYNCFIYPAYDIEVDNRGHFFRRYTGFYPLNPTMVTFLQDESNRMFIKLGFGDGSTYIVPYEDIIHVRKKFSMNDILGGDRNGRPDNESLLRILRTEHSILEGLEKAIPTSLNIRGVLRINSLIDDEKQEAERQRFENAIRDGQASVLLTDLKSEYTPLEIDPKLVDKDTLEFIQNKILNWVGVPLKILTGDFDGEDYQMWYEQELEPLIIRMGQAFTSCLFTENELNHGNQIVFYQRDFMYMSVKSKLDLLKTAGEQGLLTDNQKLAIIGYPPIPGETGNRRTISLNFVSVDIVDEYQMKKAGVLKNWIDKDEVDLDTDKESEE